MLHSNFFRCRLFLKCVLWPSMFVWSSSLHSHREISCVLRSHLRHCLRWMVWCRTKRRPVLRKGCTQEKVACVSGDRFCECCSDQIIPLNVQAPGTSWSSHKRSVGLSVWAHIYSIHLLLQLSGPHCLHDAMAVPFGAASLTSRGLISMLYAKATLSPSTVPFVSKKATLLAIKYEMQWLFVTAGKPPNMLRDLQHNIPDNIAPSLFPFLLWNR